MKQIHRIIIAVKDLDEAVPRYEKLFSNDFCVAGPKLAEMFGVRVAGAWDLGVELLQPVAGSDSALAQDVKVFLDAKGEGICGVAFHAHPMQTSVKSVEGQGVTAYGPTFSLPPTMLAEDFGGSFTRFEETVFSSIQSLGFLLALVDVDAVSRR